MSKYLLHKYANVKNVCYIQQKLVGYNKAVKTSLFILCKGGNFLKKLWSCVGNSGNNWVENVSGHHKEFQGRRFERQPFVKAIGGIVGCVWVHKQKMELRYWREYGDEKTRLN